LSINHLGSITLLPISVTKVVEVSSRLQRLGGGWLRWGVHVNCW